MPKNVLLEVFAANSKLIAHHAKFCLVYLVNSSMDSKDFR